MPALQPHDDPGPAIIPTAYFVSFWAGLLFAARLIRYAVGFPHPHDEQSVLFYPHLADEQHARMSYVVQRIENCPVGCRQRCESLAVPFQNLELAAQSDP